MLGVAGCETYRAEPITDVALEQALTPPSADEAKIRIAALRNPLLQTDSFDIINGYTPDTAAIAAVISNTTLRTARDQVRIAEAKRKQAGLLPNPSLSFSIDVPFGSNPPGTVSGYGLGLDWEITSLLTIGATSRAAEKVIDQARLDVAWQEWQIAQAAKQATYDVVATRQQVEVAEAHAARLDKIATQFNQALQRRDITASDAGAIESAAGEARVAAAAARRDLRDAEVAFNRALGVSSETAVTLADRIELPSHADTPTVDTLLANLADHRIDLVALRRGYDSQEETLRAAILGQFPKIRLGLNQNQDTSKIKTLGPSASIDLPVFDRNQGNIAIERATRQQLFDEYVVRTFEAKSDVGRAVALTDALNDQIAVSTRQVKALQGFLDANERSMKAGNSDVTSFYNAAVALAQRQTDRLKLCQELAQTHISLELAAGVRLPFAPSTP